MLSSPIIESDCSASEGVKGPNSFLGTDESRVPLPETLNSEAQLGVPRSFERMTYILNERFGIVLNNAVPLHELTSPRGFLERPHLLRRKAFLGDAVLSMSMIDLYHKYYGLEELSKIVALRYDSLISNESLTRCLHSESSTELLAVLGVDKALIPRRACDGGTLVEGLIGALYEAGEMPAAERFIELLFGFPRIVGTKASRMKPVEEIHAETEDLSRIGSGDNYFRSDGEHLGQHLHSLKHKTLQWIGILAVRAIAAIQAYEEDSNAASDRLRVRVEEILVEQSPVGRFERSTRINGYYHRLHPDASELVWPFESEWALIGAKFLGEGMKSVRALSRRGWDFIGEGSPWVHGTPVTRE